MKREENCWKKFSFAVLPVPSVESIPGEIIFYRDLHISHTRG
jgi:hypothetical protein